MNNSRPGGALHTAIFHSLNVTSSAFSLLSDLATVKSIVPSVLDRCGSLLNNTLPATVVQRNDTDTSSIDSPQPEQVVQYYRASSFALAITGYNNSAVFLDTGDAGDTLDTPLPETTDRDLLRCLDTTIGSRVLLIDDSGVSPPGTGEARNWASRSRDLGENGVSSIFLLAVLTRMLFALL
jgi:hypothetical protein